MTGARRNRKAARALASAAARSLIAFAMAGGAPFALQASTTEQVVVDWRTGLAIHGFDPVAYFTDQRALLGRPELELPFSGAVWRFRNIGNRAAFTQRPDIYTPRFGGYDPLAVARGAATPGHPLLWLIVDDRLYFFQTVETRNAFKLDAEQAINAAAAKWPELKRELVP